MEQGLEQQRIPIEKSAGVFIDISLSTYQRLVAHKLASQPQERLLKVVVGFGGDIVVLQVLLSVESDSLRLDLTFLHVDLVATEDNWDVFANTDEVT